MTRGRIRKGAAFPGPMGLPVAYLRLVGRNTTAQFATNADSECRHGFLPNDPNVTCGCWRGYVNEAQAVRADLNKGFEVLAREVQALTKAVETLERNQAATTRAMLELVAQGKRKYQKRAS